eukprot:2296977-Ditylum_brightwellii.AAC.1
MEHPITKEDLEMLWHKDQVTLPDDLKIYLVIPKAIKYVKKAPPCVACLLAKAQKQAWRSRGKHKHMRKPYHDAPGKGTSVDHMISHQPGLVPQNIGTLTHDRYWK